MLQTEYVKIRFVGIRECLETPFVNTQFCVSKIPISPTDKTFQKRVRQRISDAKTYFMRTEVCLETQFVNRQAISKNTFFSLRDGLETLFVDRQAICRNTFFSVQETI